MTTKLNLTWKYDILHLMLLSFVSLALSLIEFAWQLPAILQLPRILLGSLQVLFITGYFLQLIVFPSNESLNSFERIGLSIGLSIALLAPMTVGLEYFNFSMRPQVLAFSHHFLTALLAFIAFIRRFTVAELSRAYLSYKMDSLPNTSRSKKLLVALVFSLIASAILLSMLMIALRGPTKFDTEFYMLGAEGLAADFPREVRLNEFVSLSVLVANSEGQSLQYRIEVFSNDLLIEEIDSFQLDDASREEIQLSFPALSIGDDQLFEIRLFREGNPDTYRVLELWINVIE